jgi:bifunctional DNase/RNase
MKFIFNAQLLLVLCAGIALGSFMVWTHVKADNALGLATQCQSNQSNLTKELNEHILPQVQKEIEKLKVVKKNDPSDRK